MTDTCPYPGQPGYEGALDPANADIAELFRYYKKLGPWAMEAHMRELTARQASEVVWLIYELDIENERLKRAYPDVRMLWDAGG